MNAPTIAEQIACMSDITAFGNDMRLSILASLERLRDIDKRLDEQTVPVEPVVFIHETYAAETREVEQHEVVLKSDYDSLQSALQRAQEDRDSQANSAKYYIKLFEERTEECIGERRAREAAESLNNRMVELLKEPSAEMKNAADKVVTGGYSDLCGKEDIRRADCLEIFRAIYAELLKEIDK